MVKAIAPIPPLPQDHDKIAYYEKFLLEMAQEEVRYRRALKKINRDERLVMILIILITILAVLV